MEEKNVNEVESNHVSEDSSPPEKNEANNNESSEKVSEKSSENVLNEQYPKSRKIHRKNSVQKKALLLVSWLKLSKKKFPIPIQKKRKVRILFLYRKKRETHQILSKKIMKVSMIFKTMKRKNQNFIPALAQKFQSVHTKKRFSIVWIIFLPVRLLQPVVQFWFFFTH